jgi:PAS domain S-box-containing protein
MLWGLSRLRAFRARESIVALARLPLPWQNHHMAVPDPSRHGAGRPKVAPALFRLLAESALSRAALDACGMPVVLADAAAETPPICYVNRAFEGFFGYRAAEALGRPAATLPFTDARAGERLFREPETQLLLRAQRKDGSPAHVEVSVGAVRGVDGRVTHWVLAFADRTELEELRAKLEMLGSLASAR